MTTSPTKNNHPELHARSERLPLVGGGVDFSDSDGVAQMLQVIRNAPLPDVPELAKEPFVGVTTDGAARQDVYPTGDHQTPSADAARAAEAYLAGLTGIDRDLAQLPMDSTEWRMWINAFITFESHGYQLQQMSETELTAALTVMETSLSPEGYRRVREAMKLNGELAAIEPRYPDTLTEFAYWFTIFGTPSADQSWGWQLMGHHVVVNCVFADGQMTLTPMFIGSEFNGDKLFSEHRELACSLMDGLAADQRDRAILYPSMFSAELPEELGGAVDGRHRGGAGRDNLVLPYDGVHGADLSATQREKLLALVDPFIEALPEQSRLQRRALIEQHLDETWFAWIGSWGLDDPFYYRIHSPVILIEYDNHPGIILGNEEPEPYHVHTIVRTPNGGDYGTVLADRSRD